MKKTRSQSSNFFRTEYCANPWNGKCKRTDIVLYIFYKGSRVPICRSCWNEIANKDFEWSEDYAL